MSSSKKIDLQRDFVAGVSEAPSPPRFLFGGCLANFVGSESGQLNRLKLLQNIVSNRTQHTQQQSSHVGPPVNSPVQKDKFKEKLRALKCCALSL